MNCRIQSPTAQLKRILQGSNSNIARIDNTTTWNDKGYPANKRQARFLFFVNKSLVKLLDFAPLSTPVPIGVGSTYGTGLILPNGVSDIVNYLQSQNIQLVHGATIKLYISAKNALGQIDSQSNAIEFVYTDSNQVCAGFISYTALPFVAFDGRCLMPY